MEQKNLLLSALNLRTPLFNDESRKEKKGGAITANGDEKSFHIESKAEFEKPGSAVNPSPKAPEVPDNDEFEQLLKLVVIPPNEIGVRFADIDALDETKKLLKTLVILPLRRPELFKGSHLKPCRGILLFGPPGTGKTMLAKALAQEAGASFINVSVPTITSRSFGEDVGEDVQAVFTLAAKYSPSLIFVDEADSMFGKRRSGEPEATRRIKNEFLTNWDEAGEKILVLATTNKPFDLDEAYISRFERRIMVGLPSEGFDMSDLEEWNEVYGAVGSRKKAKRDYIW